MYEEAQMEIWIRVAEVVIIGVFVVLGLLKALRQGRKSTDFRMMVEIEAAKLKAEKAEDEGTNSCTSAWVQGVH